jgi:hypothetical protein
VRAIEALIEGVSASMNLTFLPDEEGSGDRGQRDDEEEEEDEEDIDPASSHNLYPSSVMMSATSHITPSIDTRSLKN